MSIKWVISAVLATTVLSGCNATVNQPTEQVTGQKFESKRGCVRTEAPDRFDARCDVPLLGYSGFSTF
jgi:outer membrane murein-binding lipoprotein Lpp